MGLIGSIFLWAKYKDVIEEGRRRYNGMDYMRDFEFLANEILRIKQIRDPSYKLPATLTQYVPDK